MSGNADGNYIDVLMLLLFQSIKPWNISGELHRRFSVSSALVAIKDECLHAIRLKVCDNDTESLRADRLCVPHETLRAHFDTGFVALILTFFEHDFSSPFHLRGQVGVGNFQVVFNGRSHTKLLVVVISRDFRRSPLLVCKLQCSDNTGFIECRFIQKNPFSHIGKVCGKSPFTAIGDTRTSFLRAIVFQIH